jgi:hypothetical protein
VRTVRAAPRAARARESAPWHAAEARGGGSTDDEGEEDERMEAVEVWEALGLCVCGGGVVGMMSEYIGHGIPVSSAVHYYFTGGRTVAASRVW